MTTESDYGRYVQICHKFQVHGYLSKEPPHELSAMSSTWPFASWGIDVIGLIEPFGFNGQKFILSSNYYYKKWVKVAS